MYSAVKWSVPDSSRLFPAPRTDSCGRPWLKVWFLMTFSRCFTPIRRDDFQNKHGHPAAHSSHRPWHYRDTSGRLESGPVINTDLGHRCWCDFLTQSPTFPPRLLRCICCERDQLHRAVEKENEPEEVRNKISSFLLLWSGDFIHCTSN